MNNQKRIMVNCVALFLLAAASFGKASQNQNWEKLKQNYTESFNELSSPKLIQSAKKTLPLMCPLCFVARHQAFIKLANKMGVSSKKAESFLEVLESKVRVMQVKAFWHNKHILGGNPFVKITDNNVAGLLAKSMSVNDLFLYKDSRSEPPYLSKYKNSVCEENKDFLEQLYSQSYVKSLDKPQPSKKVITYPYSKQINQEKICQLFQKPVDQCDVQVVIKDQKVQLDPKDLNDENDETVDFEEPAFFEGDVESSSNWNQFDPTDEFESLLDRYVKGSENVTFGDQGTFEYWLYSFYKEVNAISKLSAENRENGVRFVFEMAKTSFKKDPQILQLFCDTEKK